MHVLVSPYTKYTWGHLVRCLAVADALVALGHRVTFACGAHARPQVAAAGHAFVEHVSVENQDLLGHASDPWWPRALAAARETIRRASVDVVLTDLQPIVNVAAALECVPSASLLNLELVDAPLGWWLPALDAIFATLEIPRWAAARTFGDALIVCDMPDAIGLRDLAPALAARISASVRELRFVGPVLRHASRRWARPDAPRQRVVVSFGERGGATTLAAVLDGCAEVDADFLVVTDRPPTTARTRRGTLTFVGFLADFAAELSRADALITHGGHGTLVQALSMGIPTLVVPTTQERELNARRLRGLGEVASPNPSVMQVSIGAQLAALLADHARDARRAGVAEALASLGGTQQVALVIDRLARTSLPEAEI